MFKVLKDDNSRQAKRQEVAENWLRCEGATGVELHSMKQDEHVSVWRLDTNDILVVADEVHFETNAKVGPIDGKDMMYVTDGDGNKYRLSCFLIDGVKHW